MHEAFRPAGGGGGANFGGSGEEQTRPFGRRVKDHRWVDALPVLRRSDIVLFILTGRSSGLSWTSTSVMISVVSATVPRVDVIEVVELRKCVVRDTSCQCEVKKLSEQFGRTPSTWEDL
jgi:hypothetical protein